MAVVIHHNPDCGTSRNVLEMIRASGIEPVVIEYLDTGWTKPQLLALFAACRRRSHPARGAARHQITGGRTGLLDESVSHEKLLGAMVAHPVLVNRPIIASLKGVRLCRPSERVFDLLDALPPGPLSKDGTPVINAEGRRLG